MPKGQPDKGYVLTPQREKVLRILATEGPLDDEAGLVVSRLRERTGHENTQSLSMVIKQLETSGLIKRDVAGRRTYHLEIVQDAIAPEDRERLGRCGHHVEPVAASPEPDAPQTFVDTDDTDSTEPTDGTDYRRLADELLKAALAAASRKGTADPKLKLQVAELEDQLAKERLRLDDLAAQLLQRGNELLEAKDMIKTLENNLKVVRTQREKANAARGSDSVAAKLTDRERKELDALKRLMQERPGA